MHSDRILRRAATSSNISAESGPSHLKLLPSQRRLHHAIQAGLEGQHTNDVARLQNRLPNFIIIGAAKSATTTLTTILPRHPQLFISKPKEPKFFGRRYDKGWEWYARLFRRARPRQLRGEASTMYSSALLSYEHAPALMHRYLPGLKLIYIVRDPLERAISQWRHRKGRQQKTADFSHVMHSRHLRRLIVGCSLYHQRLEAFRRFYPDDQIHCILFEDLIKQPRATLKSTLTFLGVKSNRQILNQLLEEGQLPRVNEAGDKGRLPVDKPAWEPQAREAALKLIRPDAERMLAYLKRPSSTWKLD